MKGIYILLNKHLEFNKTIKIGMSLDLENRLYDYESVFANNYYVYCYILDNYDFNYIHSIETIILNKTLKYRNYELSSEYRYIFDNFNITEYHELIINILNTNNIEYNILDKPTMEKKKKIIKNNKKNIIDTLNTKKSKINVLSASNYDVKDISGIVQNTNDKTINQSTEFTSKLNTVKFKSEYLFKNQNEKIRDNKGFISEYVQKWYNSESIKALCIKSPCNTGKTKLLGKVINEFKIQKVLFISYRRSLSKEFTNIFDNINLKSYLNNDFCSDKLVCQIESLYKLIRYWSTSNNNQVLSYDLVILDEVESILNHYSSSTIIDKENTYNIMCNIIKSSKKIIAFDSDYSGRSHDYIHSFGNVITLENTINKDPKHFIFMGDESEFKKRIETDLKHKKNIVLASMSLNKANEYYKIFNKSYKTVIYTSKNSNELNKISNVNKVWVKYQLIIYTSVVESGIDFNVKHFDKLYAILSLKSTSPRGLLQMISRIRHINDNNIYTFTNNMSFSQNSNLVTLTDMIQCKEQLCHKYIKPHFIIDSLNETCKIKYNNQLYINTVVHNEVEKLNKNSEHFMLSLTTLLDSKKYTYNINDYVFNKTKITINNEEISVNSIQLYKQQIINSNDITKKIFDEYMWKVVNNDVSENEKLCIRKYKIKQFWNVDKIDIEFMNNYFGKENVLINLKYLFGEDISNYLDYTEPEIENKKKIIDNIIEIVGFNLNDLTKGISSGEIYDNAKILLNNSYFCRNYDYVRVLFGKQKRALKKNLSGPYFIRCVNSFLISFGLIIACYRKSILSNGKVHKKTTFYLDVLEIFKTNIKLKYFSIKMIK